MEYFLQPPRGAEDDTGFINSCEGVDAVVIPPTSEDTMSIVREPCSRNSTAGSTTTITATAATDQLERCGRWLSSIPRDDVTVLRGTPEYQEFLRAFERLGCAHRRVISCIPNETSPSHGAATAAEVISRSSWSSQNHASLLGSSPNSSSDTGINSVLSTTSNSSTTEINSHIYPSNFSGSYSTKIPCTVAATISTPILQQQLQYAQTQHMFLNVFLQHTDDVILRILEFLESQSLIRAALTCSRFLKLADKSATQRTYDIAHSRQLGSVMQLLRAREQIFEGGSSSGSNDSTTAITPGGGHVRVPILLLGRRVMVTNAGDPEYNGVYYCTNANGNGFVFTKPRYPIQRSSSRMSIMTSRQSSGRALHQPQHMDLEEDDDDNNNGNLQGPRGGQWQQQPQQQQHFQPPGMVIGHNHHPHPAAVVGGAAVAAGIPQNDEFSSTRYEGETAKPGQPLRCIISKRFSNETILWYMSKEVEVATDTNTTVPTAVVGVDQENGTNVHEIFSFWAKLMVLGAASPDACRYPSQTSVLARQSEGWQSLLTAIRPPSVELLD